MVILTKNMGISRFFEVTDVCIPNNYEIQMLINNDLKYVPFCSLREINGMKSLRVKIDGLSPLSDKYGRSIPSMKDVKKLLKDLKKCLMEIRHYLLDPNRLVLNTRYILFDESSGLHRFVYVPGMVGDFKEQLKNLFEEIMRIYDHQDHDGVMYLYDMYSKVLGDNFTPELFLKMIGEEKKERKEQIVRPEITEIREWPKENDVLSETSYVENSKKSGRTAHILVSAVAVVISVCLYVLFGVQSFKVSAILAVILVAYLILDYLRLKEEREEEETMRNYVQKNEREEDKKSFVVPMEDIEVLKKPLIREDFIDTTILSSRNADSVSCLVPCEKNRFQEIYLIEGETRVGRQKSVCDYCLNDSSVSRVHAIFEKKGDRVLVRDAGSTNGTYVNDRRISVEEEAEASIGDMISIADIRYECV